MLQADGSDQVAALAGSFNYLMLAGYVCGGWQMARSALAAQAGIAAGREEGFYRSKLLTAAFYAEQILPEAGALLAAVKAGASYAQDIPDEQF